MRTRVSLALLAATAAIVPVTVAVAQDPAPPAATTQAPRALTEVSATLVATVDPRGADTTARFRYGRAGGALSTLSPTRQVTAAGGPAEVAIPVSGLAPSTAYEVQVAAGSAAGVAEGARVAFRTRPAPRPPDAETRTVTNVASDAATLRAGVGANGRPTTVRFEYGTTSALGRTSPTVEIPGIFGVQTVRIRVGDLPPRSLLFYRVVASNALGRGVGATRTFTTPRRLEAMTLEFGAEPAAWGSTLRASGQVQGAGQAGAPIALEAYAGGRWVQLGRAGRVDAQGGYLFTYGPVVVPLRLRAITRTNPAISSRVRDVRVRPRVGLVVRGASRGRRLFKGTVRPALTDARVSLQRRTSRGRWAVVARRSTTKGRKARQFSITVRARRGTYRVVAVTQARGWSRGVSRARAVGGSR